jgi:hypothetical protein
MIPPDFSTGKRRVSMYGAGIYALLEIILKGCYLWKPTISFQKRRVWKCRRTIRKLSHEDAAAPPVAPGAKYGGAALPHPLNLSGLPKEVDGLDYMGDEQPDRLAYAITAFQSRAHGRSFTE